LNGTSARSQARSARAPTSVQSWTLSQKIAEKEKSDNAKISKQERTEALPVGQCVRQGLRPWNPESALRKALAKSK
jgi:hypothetical protein